MSFKDKLDLGNVARTRNSPSFLIGMLIDGIMVAITALIAWIVQYKHLSLDLELMYRRGEELTREFVLGIAYDAITTTIAVFLAVFVAMYLYWLRPELMRVVSQARWLLLARRYGLDLQRPDVELDGGIGWYLEQLNGKDIHLIACLAHDGSLTIVDRPSEGFTPIAGAVKA